MIYIENNEHHILPKEFIESHNFCVNLYDLILETIKHDAFKELYVSKIEVPIDNSSINVDDLKDNDPDLLKWLKDNGHNEIVTNILSKRILTALVPDMLQFVHEGLSCLMRGKTTVALSNFRKPINENLLVLERLYHDKESYIQDFFFKPDSRKFEPNSKTINKKKVIEEVLAKFENPFFKFLSADLIHDLRFAKDINGFNPLFNKAIHIVTNDANYRTEATNFNFVFSNKEDIYNQWKFIYDFLPYLLIYVTNLVLYIANDLIDLDSRLIENREFRVFAGAFCWFDSTDRYKETLPKLIEIFKKIDFECFECKTIANLDMHDFELIYKMGIRPCLNCLHSIIPYSDELVPEVYLHDYKREDFGLGWRSKIKNLWKKIFN